MQGDHSTIQDVFLTNSQASRNLGALISRRPFMSPAALAAADSGPLTCFHTLVAGAGSLQATMSRTRVAPFRCACPCPC